MKSATTATTAIILATLSTTSDGFSLPLPKSAVVSKITALNMAEPKGFGVPKKEPKKKAPDSPLIAERRIEQKGEPMITSSSDKDFNPFDKSPQSGVPLKTDTFRGKTALDKMRREKAEERNAELQKMKAVQDVDAMMLETGGEAAVIPEKVAQRMGKRMLPFVGVPLLGGMGAFVGFWYMATYRDVEFQPVLVAGSTIALLATGLIGITYSMMSASWDPEREGSVLGTDEFSRNIDNIKGGLNRSRDNAAVREQIMIEENRMRQTQAPKEPKKPAATSLAEKMGDELD